MATHIPASTLDDDELRALVARHKVSFATRPIRRVTDRGELAAIGFEIELLGVHDSPQHAPEPGCDECTLVHHHLRSIAEAVLPKERDSRLEVSAYEPKLVFDRRYHGAPAVILSIEIVHSSGYERPVDACEERCKNDVCSALRSLGAVATS